MTEEEAKEPPVKKSKELRRLEKRAAFNETEHRIKALRKWKIKLAELLAEAKLLAPSIEEEEERLLTSQRQSGEQRYGSQYAGSSVGSNFGSSLGPRARLDRSSQPSSRQRLTSQ